MSRLFLIVLLALPLAGCGGHRTIQEPMPDAAVYEGVPVQSLPPVRPREHAVISSTPAPAQTEVETSAAPRMSATPHTATSTTTAAQFPTAKAVPGKPGFVYSPYDGAMIDVTGFSSGSKAKDPATNKIFIVP